MKDGIGPGMTRDDHKELAAQLFAAYARVRSIRSLASVIGEEELSDLDRSYLGFGDRFEREFLAQGEYENRSIDQTLDLGWQILTALPRAELYRVSEKTLEQRFGKGQAETRQATGKDGGGGR
jgi:V/A-type H+-transporting ATPase subunit B